MIHFTFFRKFHLYIDLKFLKISRENIHSIPKKMNIFLKKIWQHLSAYTAFFLSQAVSIRTVFGRILKFPNSIQFFAH